MIHLTDRLLPTPEQLAHARKWADSSFCAASDEGFMRNFPMFDGWQPADSHATLLRLRNVEPHDDPWVARSKPPRVRRAIFWLLQGGFAHDERVIHFGCGGKIVKMRAGDFVVFDDSKTHWVMSDRVWRGAAIQLNKSTSKDVS